MSSLITVDLGSDAKKVQAEFEKYYNNRKDKEE